MARSADGGSLAEAALYFTHAEKHMHEEQVFSSRMVAAQHLVVYPNVEAEEALKHAEEALGLCCHNHLVPSASVAAAPDEMELLTAPPRTANKRRQSRRFECSRNSVASGPEPLSPAGALRASLLLGIDDAWNKIRPMLLDSSATESVLPFANHLRNLLDAIAKAGR